MKSTEAFKKTIHKYLEDRAGTDPLFADTFKKDGKNIDDCVTYILNFVQKSGCNGFADDEIYSMAVHYYDEDKIDVGKPISSKVVVNHQIELSNEEKELARKNALKQFEDEQLTSMRKQKEDDETKARKKQQSQEKREEQKRLRPEAKLKKMQQTLF